MLKFIFTHTFVYNLSNQIQEKDLNAKYYIKSDANQVVY